jgi:type IV fimbrial biogenesis protein FimT
VAKNSCATICASTTVSSSVTSGNACSNNGTSDDFQKGWVVFINPACDSTQTDPTLANAVLVSQRQSATTGYTIKPSAAGLSMVMFDPRGFANLTATGYFTITSPSSDSSLQRIVCIQASGQSTVRRDTSC